MRRLVVPIAAVALVVVVGETVGYRLALAPVIGLGLWVWLRATMRSFLRGGQTGVAATDEPRPVDDDERVLYWCEECGTELALLVRGSGVAPRHCATRMFERSEVVG